MDAVETMPARFGAIRRRLRSRKVLMGVAAALFAAMTSLAVERARSQAVARKIYGVWALPETPVNAEHSLQFAPDGYICKKGKRGWFKTQCWHISRGRLVLTFMPGMTYARSGLVGPIKNAVQDFRYTFDIVCIYDLQFEGDAQVTLIPVSGKYCTENITLTRIDERLVDERSSFSPSYLRILQRIRATRLTSPFEVESRAFAVHVTCLFEAQKNHRRHCYH